MNLKLSYRIEFFYYLIIYYFYFLISLEFLPLKATNRISDL